jgi:hypothetical protein
VLRRPVGEEFRRGGAWSGRFSDCGCSGRWPSEHGFHGLIDRETRRFLPR